MPPSGRPWWGPSRRKLHLRAAQRLHPIGVDDDFAAGQTGISLRATSDESAGRVDEQLRLRAEFGMANHGVDDVALYLLSQLVERNIRIVLGREHDGFDAGWPSIGVTERDLRFRVRL